MSDFITCVVEKHLILRPPSPRVDTSNLLPTYYYAYTYPTTTELISQPTERHFFLIDDCSGALGFP